MSEKSLYLPIMNQNKLIILYGATGVGKTDTAFALEALGYPLEIVNGDIGQFYEPCAIGTAKPDWKNEKIPHHLFDICDTPRDMTVTAYRELLLQTVSQVWSRGAVPIIVGGSGFYLKSLFFPPKEFTQEQIIDQHMFGNKTTAELWTKLTELDPERAQALPSSDRYRIIRALIITQQGKKASLQVPEYKSFPHENSQVALFFLSRPREQLYQRINDRVELMMNDGWVNEVKRMLNTPWESFLIRKKLIGYPEIINFLRSSDQSEKTWHKVVTLIQQKTRHYAKRQYTFWRMLQRSLEQETTNISIMQEIDLTDKNSTLIQTIEEFLGDRSKKAL